MSHNEVYMSIEISEYSIKAIASEYFNAKQYVLASTEILLQENAQKEDVEQALIKAKEDIISKLGYDIKNTILIIPSYHCKKVKDKVKINTINKDCIITKDEIALGLKELMEKHDNQDEFVVNVLIDRYSAYGYGYVSNPVGLETRHIEIEASIYLVPTIIAYPLIKLVEESGLNIVNVCLDIIALKTVIMPDNIAKSGGIIIDLNASTTNIAYFKNNTLRAYSSLDVGQKHITKDIVDIAKLDYEKAERFKQKYVNLDVDNINDLVIYRYFDEVNNQEVDISQRFISRVAYDRYKEILRLINQELASFDLEENTIIYLCSGGNMINGLDKFLKQELAYPYEIAKLNNVGARYSGYQKCLGSIINECKYSRIKGEIKLFVNKNEYKDVINLVEKNNLLYNNNNDVSNEFIKRLVSYIFNN